MPISVATYMNFICGTFVRFDRGRAMCFSANAYARPGDPDYDDIRRNHVSVEVMTTPRGKALFHGFDVGSGRVEYGLKAPEAPSFMPLVDDRILEARHRLSVELVAHHNARLRAKRLALACVAMRFGLSSDLVPAMCAFALEGRGRGITPRP